MNSNEKAVVTGLMVGVGLIGGAYLIASLIHKAVDTGNSEIAKTVIDGANDIAKEHMKSTPVKVTSDIGTTALKAAVDVLEKQRVERQRRWW